VPNGIIQIDPSYRHNFGAIAIAIATTVEPSSSTALDSDRPKVERQPLPVPAAVLLWYLLGVLSIASSKVLLSPSTPQSSSSGRGRGHRSACSPLVLTAQQLAIGATLLRVVIELTTNGRRRRRWTYPRTDGSHHVPPQGGGGGTVQTDVDHDGCEAGATSAAKRDVVEESSSSSVAHNKQLTLTATYFAFGFLLTNIGFMMGSAAFVETIKAAEPITSASVAAIWGIEHPGREEVMSLMGIVVGVVLSTFGNQSGGIIGSGAIDVGIGATRMRRSPSSSSFSLSSSPSLPTLCLIVMAANLCFSFRGLHQKLFRSTLRGSAIHVDDLTLQCRMQQLGALVLGVPALLSFVLSHGSDSGAVASFGIASSSFSSAMEYALLSLANGVAFATYNLASTYVLTRMSVVHHAALNCVRRVFAIVVTSIIFGSTITPLQITGMTIAVLGFFSYVHFKSRKETKDWKRMELRRKYGGILTTKLTTAGLNGMRNNGARWRTGHGRSSSFLPTNSPTK
jgi:drug/metabolite transporter (DMT)-like permease